MRPLTRSRTDLRLQLYTDIITIDPLGNRFAAQNVNKQGVDHLGPALPEQLATAKQRRKAASRRARRELLAAYSIFGIILVMFLVGRMTAGESIESDLQNALRIITILGGTKS